MEHLLCGVNLRNGGNWTDAKFNSFIKSILRGGSKRWPPKYDVLNEACVGQKVNTKTGRLAKHYKCASCLGEFPAKEVQVDHKEPIIDPAVGFVSWDSVVDRMFCEKDNLQVLCTDPCHKLKTAAEKQQAKERRNDSRKV